MSKFERIADLISDGIRGRSYKAVLFLYLTDIAASLPVVKILEFCFGTKLAADAIVPIILSAFVATQFWFFRSRMTPLARARLAKLK